MELLDGHELEIYLGKKFSYWTILELAKEGQIPHIRIGRKVFFRKESIEQWLTAIEQGRGKK